MCQQWVHTRGSPYPMNVNVASEMCKGRYIASSSAIAAPRGWTDQFRLRNVRARRPNVAYRESDPRLSPESRRTEISWSVQPQAHPWQSCGMLLTLMKPRVTVRAHAAWASAKPS